MKIRISALLLILAFAFSFSSCKKDDKVIPDITGRTYETYKMETSVSGQTEIAKDGEYYFQWKFAEGGTLVDENGLELGTWNQDGENVTITEDGNTINGKVNGDDLTFEFEFILTVKYYMRKVQ